MLVTTASLLDAAEAGRYAVGGFNIYNLEGARAVVEAAEALRSPAILQIHQSALDYGGDVLIALSLAAARAATVPLAVHLDHSAAEVAIVAALGAGVGSVMADGSTLPYEENVVFTQAMTVHAHRAGASVEAELGRLSGSEDGLTVPEYEALLTDPGQAVDFVARTGVDALAVCIGNAHGRYRRPPVLDWERLTAVRRAVDVRLVLHGASGLPDETVRHAIELGVSKFNVNTEVREAYLATLRACGTRTEPLDLLPILRMATAAMRAVIEDKLRLFGSAGQAPAI